jgi:integrase/recombinase XerD
LIKKDKKVDLYNSENERTKYKYRQHLRRVGQKDEKTVLATLKHIRDFEIFISFEAYHVFSPDIADMYIQSMFKAGLSLSYITDNIRALKDFLRWLERQHGCRSKINYNHIDYLNISRNQRKQAKAVEYQKAYKYEEIILTIRGMPDNTDKEKRDKAIISLQALCTLRISELQTVKIKNLIEESGQYFIYVCPKSMSVKNAKTRHAVFVPLPRDIIQNVLQWYDHIRLLGFKETDPLFPKVDSRFEIDNMLEKRLKREAIK